MISLLAALAALTMFLPDTPKKPCAAPGDTIYVVIYRHIETSLPIPGVVDDSVHIYDPGVKP